jgi:hypothetical protein
MILVSAYDDGEGMRFKRDLWVISDLRRLSTIRWWAAISFSKDFIRCSSFSFFDPPGIAIASPLLYIWPVRWIIIGISLDLRVYITPASYYHFPVFVHLEITERERRHSLKSFLRGRSLKQGSEI